jgi:TrmH family RNA methyltransferase
MSRTPERITSRQNSLLVQAVRLQSSKRFRQQQGLFVGDGTKLLGEAVTWMPECLRAVILREGVPVPELPDHVRLVEVSPQLMAQISAMETPEGALFLCALPPEAAAVVTPGTLVLDGIQDPGNMGTILRTADALGVPVLLSEGCVDPYSPKTVRATMGAIFRTPPQRIGRQALVDQCRQRQIPLLATALSQSARDLRQVDLRGAAVVIGSEGQGVSQMLLDASDGQIIIPMTARCESLNAAVAAAIALWQMTEL